MSDTSLKPKQVKSVESTTTAAAANKDQRDRTVTVEDDACVVCFKNVDIYSIGECDHPVCYECSTRMRVLCQQNECPICRQVLSKVIFTHDVLPYRELEAKNRSEYYSKKYKICFYTNKIQQAFFDLLDHPCPKCNAPPYRTFQGLKNHVRKEHDLHYCDLCTDNLKIFTFERRCYTQTELGLHRTKGDVDNRSHRGHPLCEYCNKRYLDRDELFRHLRREHYFCHFCDADGCNEFYKDYDALAEHFRQDHFLCEEGKCATDQFVGAFRTDIDYKAHVANVHGKLLSKQQVKQTRTLQLEITLGPRGRSGQTEQGVANVRGARGNEENREEIIDEYYAQMSQQNQGIDAHNEQDFPSLGGGSGPNLSLTRPPPLSMRHRGTAGLARTKENFPALGGAVGLATTVQRPQVQQQVFNSSSSGAINSAVQRSQSQKQFPAAAGGSVAGLNAAGSNEQFPALGKGMNSFAQRPQYPPIASVIKKPAQTATGAVSRTSNTANGGNNSGMVIHVSNRPNVNGTSSKKPSGFDFPALPAGKSKKHAPRNAAVDEDLLPSTSNIPMTNVSAKHRTLVDDYVSVAHPSTFQKLQMVQKEESEAKARRTAEQMNAPKLTTFDFPSLGGGGSNGGSSSSTISNKPTSSNQAQQQWTSNKTTSDKKQRELENRRAKVAPAPILPSNNSKTSTSNKSASNNNSPPLPEQLQTKKEKKNKEKKSSPETNPTSQQPKGNGKSKEKNNNNENKPSNVNDATSDVRPPPGFGSDNNQINAMKPPPGFHSNVTVKSVAKSPNNLTFTSSLGESYSIVPTHVYSQPPEAITRNQKLVGHFKNALKSPEALEEFRHISQKFREGVYKAPAYYEHCQAALKEQFNQVFPELLALLPDITKQQALYLIHTQHLNTMSPNQRKSSSQLSKLDVCSTCKQVLLISDLDNHRKLHDLKENFPTLRGNGAGGKSSGGNRK